MMIQPDKTPLAPGGASFTTSRLKDCGNGRYEFRSTLGYCLVLLPFFVVGLAAVIAGITKLADELHTGIGIIVFGCFFLVIVYALGFQMFRRGKFDFQKKCYWKDRKDPNYRLPAEDLRDHIPFREIAALQILRETCRGSKGSTWFSYELNIVCQDGSRKNVVDHGGAAAVREDAAFLAEKLGVPVLNCTEDNSAKEIRRKKNNRVALRIVGGVFGFIGAIMCWQMIVKPVVKTIEMGDWEKAPAVITFSDMTTRQIRNKKKGGYSTYYNLILKYSYHYQGVAREGTEYDVVRSGNMTQNRSSVRKITKRYPVGTKTHCFVNPADPTEALLVRELGWTFYWQTFFSLCFFGAGLVTCCFGFRSSEPSAAGDGNASPEGGAS